jgi:hypothetical protein
LTTLSCNLSLDSTEETQKVHKLIRCVSSDLLSRPLISRPFSIACRVNVVNKCFHILFGALVEGSDSKSGDRFKTRDETARWVVLRPLSYFGAAHPLMLPLSCLLPYVYLPDRSTAYTGLTLAVAAISMLSSYRPNTSTSVRTMTTFLFRLAFPRLSNHSLASCYKSSPVFLVRMSQFFVYLLRLFCYLLSTILRISQPISKLLTHLLTVL